MRILAFMLERYSPSSTIKNNFKGFIDVSLREGEQFAGARCEDESGEISFAPVEFTLEQAGTILGNLRQIGVPYSEVSNPIAPGMGDFVRQLTQIKERPRLLAHIRNHNRDFQAAVEAEVDGVDILTTVDLERLKHMNVDYQAYLSRLQQIIQGAQAHGLETRVSVEHAWKLCYEGDGFERMMEVYRLADSLKADRVGIADTLGIANRFDVEQVVRAVASQLTHSQIEFHGHNDTQAATSNAFEALHSGAGWIDTSLGGFGERTGITPLSGIATLLHTTDPSILEGYNLRPITSSEQYMASIFKLHPPHNIPSAGNAFAHHAGIHLNLIQTMGPGAYEPLQPSIVGNRRHIIDNSRISGKTQGQAIYSQYGLG